MEQWATDLLIDTGVGERLKREAMFHDGIYFCFDGALHHINFRKLIGKGVTIYGQQEVVKDLIERRLADGGQILFEVLGRQRPRHHRQRAEDPLPPRRQGPGARLRFHRRLRRLPRHLPAEHSRRRAHASTTANIRSAGSAFCPKSPPPEDELIYTYSPRGFALLHHALADARRGSISSARPTTTSRTGPTSASGTSCETRLGGTRPLAEGAMLQKGITADAQLRRRADAVRPAVPGRRLPPTSSRRPAPRA